MHPLCAELLTLQCRKAFSITLWSKESKDFFYMTFLHINVFNIVASFFSVWVLCQVKLQQGPMKTPRDWERWGTEDELYPLHTWSRTGAWSFLPHHTLARTRLPLTSCCMVSQIPCSNLWLHPMIKVPRRNCNTVLWIPRLPVLPQGAGDGDYCAPIPFCKSAPANIEWILLQITCP